MGTTVAGSTLRAFRFTTMALQHAQGRGRPRGGLWWLGRCWTAPSLAAPLWQPQRVLLPPLTGAMLLCQLTADARNCPGDRAAWWIRRGNREQGATAATGEIDVRL